MPRIVATTSFEDLGYLNLPIFDFKFVRFTPRQLIILTLFTVLSYSVFSSVLPLLFPGTMERLFGAVAVFVIGAALFVRRGRVFAPEWYLLYFVRKSFGPRMPKRTGRAKRRKGVEAAEIEARPMLVPLGEPTRIAGILFDPSTGRRLSNAVYEIEAEGKPYHSGVTDRDGAYSILFTPPHAGAFVMTIRPRGHSRNAEEIRVEVGSAVPAEQRIERRAPLRTETSEGGVKQERKPVARGYVYELFPTNFVNLPDQEQDRTVDNFRRFLNSLEGQVKITAVRSSKEVALGESVLKTEYFKFFVQSREPIDAQLDSAGLNYQRTTESPEPAVSRFAP